MKSETRTSNDRSTGERLRTLSDAELSTVAGGTILPTEPPEGITIVPPDGGGGGDVTGGSG